MKKETGWMATILMALAAVLGFSALPKGSAPDMQWPERTTVAPGPMMSRASKEAAPPELKESPCWQIEKSVLIFLDAGKYAAPGSCVNKPQDAATLNPDSPTSHAQLRFVVATVPDPVHTHFPLLFDRLIEALQQAAQDQGYNYDSSSLPWAPPPFGASKEAAPSADASAQQQMQPGVLVFRKALPSKSEYCESENQLNPSGKGPEDLACKPPVPYHAGLIVFVVGENPTGGVDQDQLRNAFDWIDILSGTGSKQKPDQADATRARHKAGILGPYFSGSLPSLYQGLWSDHILASAKPPASPDAPDKTASVAKTFPIFSGSVSSKAGIDWFNTQLADTSAQFFSFQQNDDNMIDNYCLYLRNEGYDTGQLAIMSEDETAYGFSTPTKSDVASQPNTHDNADATLWLPDCDMPPREGAASRSDSPKKGHGPLYVYYPRDIAALRSAYSQQQPSGSTKTQSSSANTLPLDLIEPASRERDTIASFGERQTTLSQEATLFGIANVFKAHDIQFIVLRSSNTLDQVFLTRFFSQAYPSARVVLTSADLLFRRSSDTSGFRGTMTLTTYPLLTWQQDWTHWQSPESRHSHRAFPEDTAEGLYLAARFLIDGGGGAEEGKVPNAAEMQTPLKLSHSDVKIQDYAPPYWLIPPSARETRDNCTVANKDGVASTTRPPTWLSVVGSGQLWPVAVIGECIPGAPGPYLFPGSVKTSTRAESAPNDTLPWADTESKADRPPDFDLPTSMFLCCVLIAGWSGWHFFCCLFGSHTSSVRIGKKKLSPSSFRSLAYFAPVPRRQHAWLIFIGCVITWLLAVETAVALGMLNVPPDALRKWPAALAFCVILGALAWAALLSNYRTYLPANWRKNDKSTTTVQNQEDLPYNTPLLLRGALAFAVAAFIVLWIFWGWITTSLGPGSGPFAMWRSVNLFTGVSPTVPILLLTAGLYGWFWYSLSGLALFNAGLPKLPHETELPPMMPMFSREMAGKRIQDAAIPLKATYGRHFLIFAGAYIAFWALAGQTTSIHALGPIVFGKIYAVVFGLLIVMILTESWQMLRAWGELRELLGFLDRLPLRRTLQALGGISWGTVWKMSGNVIEQRYRLISRELESLRHLENEIALLRAKSPARASVLAFGEVNSGHKSSKYPYEEIKVPLLYEQFDECNDARDQFARWFAANYKGCQYGESEGRTKEADLSPAANFQAKLASTAGVVFRRILLPAWFGETDSLVLDDSPAEKDKKGGPALPKEDYVKAAEEFFCLPYLGFIQNILGRIRTMTLAIIWLFLGATLSVASYPFDPRPVTSGIFVFVFIEVAAVMVFVYGQMHRDATLSHITNTNPGELGSDFWIKLITFGVGPVLGLITAAFPELTGFITSWLQPAVGSIK